ncbi:MAG: hypothetical protein J6T02_05365 [Bacteroidales bacterium]|nr:hypothetical protein [Bacteroidales bacterium]
MKKTFILVVAALAFAACNKNIDTAEFGTSLTASIENGIVKSHLSQNAVLWDVNDEISVFSLEDGAYSHAKFSTSEGGGTAVFKGPGIAVDENLFALYPYAEGNTFSAADGFSVEADYLTQKAVNGGVDQKVNIAVGKLSSENNVGFRNVGALLRFTLTQERADTTRRIEINSNDGTPLVFAGDAAILWNEGAPTIAPASNATTSDVIKIIPSGEAFATNDTYCVWVLPGQYQAGITITLVSPTQMTAVKEGTSALNIGRNQVVDLGEIGGLEFKDKGAEKKTLHFDFTGDPLEGWPTVDKWKNAPGDSLCVYPLDGVDYKFLVTDCGNASQARVAWVKDKGGLIFYAGWRYLGLPAIEGFKLVKVTGCHCLGTNVNRRAAIAKFVVADNTTEVNEYVTGGDPIAWSTQNEAYTFNLEGTEANTVYYLTCTAVSIGTSYLDLVYEKVE